MEIHVSLITRNKRQPGYTDFFLKIDVVAEGSTIIVTKIAYMTAEAWE